MAFLLNIFKTACKSGYGSLLASRLEILNHDKLLLSIIKNLNIGKESYMKKAKMFVLFVAFILVLCTLGVSAASNLTADYEYTILGKTVTEASLEYDAGTKILGILFSPAAARTRVSLPTQEISKISFFSMGVAINNWNTYASSSGSEDTCDSDGKTVASAKLSGNQYATHVSHSAYVSFNGTQDLGYSESFSN